MRRLTRITVLGVLSLSVAACNAPKKQDQATAKKEGFFRSAEPVWPEGRETEMNVNVGFRAKFEAAEGERVTLRVAAHCIYRAYINGEWIGHGPARGPHDFYRVDEWDLSSAVLPGLNVLAIEVAGYNCNSFYLLDRPSFLQAEVESAGRILASTAGAGAQFEAAILGERVQKVQRYSFQRPFIEIYRLKEGYDRWRREIDRKIDAAKLAVCETKALLPRRVPHSTFEKVPPAFYIASGQVRTGQKVEKLWKDRSLVNIGPKLKGYKEEELDQVLSTELQGIQNASLTTASAPYDHGTILKFTPSDYHIVDFGKNRSGFIGASVHAHKPARLLLTFDEILVDGDVDNKRLGCVNCVSLEMEPGIYNFESMEPYTFRYMKLIVLDGDVTVRNPYIREYVNPDTWGAHFAASDPGLKELFEAARETFRQNSIDIFMDCPSRERAGWLCDSFFTSRVALDLTGHTKIEKNFCENFLLPKKFEYIPEGMLSMCYPADHNDNVFIPNWALWFVVELEEYLARSGDRELVRALEPRLMALFKYFEQFINKDGLLEDLKGWVFVEWSMANQFTTGVNYPSNMLFAAALDAAGRMYDRIDLKQKAEDIRETVRKQSFNGKFFVDQALRKEGKLEITKNMSEVCQYFAFFFNVATPETHPNLWATLRDEFGPKRKEKGLHKQVHPANAFIGNIVRFELLSRNGLGQQILDESKDYYLYMARRTGTLWEHDGTQASCNHGFASHVSHMLYRDILGIYGIDTVRKVVEVRFCDLNLDWCEGRIPVAGGAITMSWRRADDTILYKIEVPDGWEVREENLTELYVERVP